MSDLEDRLARLEARVDELTKALQARAGRREPRPEAQPVHIETSRLTSAMLTTLIGRTCLVLGGAFLLRALTASGTVPGVLGVAMALVYASVWYVVADRTSGRESGLVHGAAAAAIGFPALFEATARFHLISPAMAAALLCAFGGLGLAVAARRGLQLAATGTVLAVIATALGLLVQTRATLTFATAILVVSSAGVAVAWWRKWPALAWLGALPLDGTLLVVLLLAMRRSNVGQIDAGYLTVLLLAAAALTAGAVAVRTLWIRGPATGWDAFQVPVTLLIAIEGAAILVPWAAAPAGGAALVLGASAYVAAFTARGPRDHRVTFFLFTTLGLALLLEGSRLALPAEAAGLAWAALAPVAAALASATRPCLRTHAAVFGLMAALAAGLPVLVEQAFTGRVVLSWPPLVVAALCGLGYVLLTRRPAAERRPFPETALVALACAGAAGALLALAEATLGEHANAATLAVARTTVLAGAAMLLAALSRHGARRELEWVAALCLVLGGVKLAVQDLPTAPPVALVASFVLYGTALIVAPRLMK